ncbi:serine/Arginine-related protein 53 isoform X2 [Hippocampus comes]|uniref:serine/Arginine-related protein 53 isoform X2 n=1 Tax=Hippocampus comes TaxID=109280 RepID=UPI00094EF710|nr:PREDICTED: serine/Arginine-related protein 53 isoform X2 [Hippocampus comes]
MGRHSSSSEGESRSRKKKKQRRRSSSSSSTSSSSSGSRVTSSRSHRSSRRSRSRSRDRRRKKRSSSSSSRSSSRKRRSRSGDKGRSHRSHRTCSRDRSRSGSRSRRGSHGRRRSRSRDRARSRHKGRDRDKDKGRDRDRDREKTKDKVEKKGDAVSMKAGLEHLTPAEQAKVRMQLVLQAAAKTDEVLKAKIAKQEQETRKKRDIEGTSLEDQVRRIKDIEAIESDSFVPQAFKSSRDDVKTDPVVKHESDRMDDADLSFPLSIVYNDSDTLAHPALFMDKEKAEEMWLNRLISLRQERLMGSPVS